MSDSFPLKFAFIRVHSREKIPPADRDPRSPTRQALSPGERELRELAGEVGLGGGSVVGLFFIEGQVVELGVGAVGIDEEFPVAAADGDIRAAVGAELEPLVVAAVFPE